MWLCKQGSACACMCICAHMHACMWLVDSVAFSMYVGFSICRLCCYCCVSIEMLSPITALKTQQQSLCL